MALFLSERDAALTSLGAEISIWCLPLSVRYVNIVKRGAPETRARRCGADVKPNRLIEEPDRHEGALIGPDQIACDRDESPFPDELERFQSAEEGVVAGAGHVDMDPSGLHGLSLVPGNLFRLPFAQEEEKPEPKFLKVVGCDLIAPHVGHDDHPACPFPCHLQEIFSSGCEADRARACIEPNPVRIGGREGVELPPAAIEMIEGRALGKNGTIDLQARSSPRRFEEEVSRWKPTRQ